MKIGVNNTACGRYGIDYIAVPKVFHVSIGFLGFHPRSPEMFLENET